MDPKQEAVPELVFSLIREKLEPLQRDIDDLMRKMSLVERTLSLTKEEGLETGSNRDDTEDTKIPDARGEWPGSTALSTCTTNNNAAGNISTTRRAEHVLVILGESGSSSARRRVTPVNDDGWEETTSVPEQEGDTQPAADMEGGLMEMDEGSENERSDNSLRSTWDNPPAPDYADEDQPEGDSTEESPQKARDRLATYLSGSVYVWACGEKSSPSDDDVITSDMTVGWLTLLAQVAAYTVLIIDAEPEEGVKYSIYSVSLAMFMMLSISSSDIRTSYTLLRWGGSFFRCLFGALLLGCTALLVVASMKVLFMDATSNAELVLGATTVLFIEDVDNKLMSFMKSVPQKWRLFFMLEILGLSYWLSVLGIISFGDYNGTLTENYKGAQLENMLEFPQVMPFLWTMTVLSFIINSTVMGISKVYRKTRDALGTSSSMPTSPSSPLPASPSSPAPPSTPSVLVSTIIVLINGVLQRIINYPTFSPAVTIWFLSNTMVSVLVLRERDSRLVSSFEFLQYLDSSKVVRCHFFCLLALFLIGAFRTTFGSRSLRPCRGTPSPSSFEPTWYRLFVGWGSGTFLQLFSVQAMSPYDRWWARLFGLFSLGEEVQWWAMILVNGALMLMDLAFFLDLDLFGKSIGWYLRIPGDFIQRKYGCIYWLFASHFLLSAQAQVLGRIVWYMFE